MSISISSSSSDDEFEFPPLSPRRLCSTASNDSDISKRSSVSGADEVEYTNCRMEELPCFHNGITRNTAEKLLIQEKDGFYLIRNSTAIGSYTVSVRTDKSVKHFQIQHDGERYSFGQALFWSPIEIWSHLNKRPVLECDEGITVQLKQPYLCENEEKVEYSVVKRHYMPDEEKMTPPTPSKRASVATLQRFTTSILGDEVSTVEGLIHKKKERKSWKRRWCVLHGHYLSYYKPGKESCPLNNLDLRKAIEVKNDNDSDKKNSFRIIFPEIYFVFSTETPEDKKMWFENIRNQIDSNKLANLQI
ncbi:dual adapter for phosphotyrosine and 3-phosphotyrosine and 3-phosphoinositide-like [Dendronephthya gigantea]|uniref:dual adapter for phosphotyrosine and 3-phosphotyrosine and 3-phosphoinositide-like n=1 Tax=Dendronephthya gigantea TaxID=151771 RepID=UPI0010695613|nr:dual adapter for phosphotyrosine and 3-phosphotyrosine and 3-phosphoinositide-like [Dendronephthya gigantea]XP_028392965.1 dual adapter for phosphotyrosine and 3-phosphotyrosine and 3-phosphoinositide-like [Dendronephthya gigantea]